MTLRDDAVEAFRRRWFEPPFTRSSMLPEAGEGRDLAGAQMLLILLNEMRRDLPHDERLDHHAVRLMGRLRGGEASAHRTARFLIDRADRRSKAWLTDAVRTSNWPAALAELRAVAADAASAAAALDLEALESLLVRMKDLDAVLTASSDGSADATRLAGRIAALIDVLDEAVRLAGESRSLDPSRG